MGLKRINSPWFLLQLHHKVHIYKEYHSGCPLVGTGTIPTPHPQASVPLPPEPVGGGTLACGWGVGGVPIPTTGCLLCELHCRPTIPFLLLEWFLEYGYDFRHLRVTAFSIEYEHCCPDKGFSSYPTRLFYFSHLFKQHVLHWTHPVGTWDWTVLRYRHQAKQHSHRSMRSYSP